MNSSAPYATYSDMMNNRTFYVYIPEYYQPLLPSHFKEIHKADPPMINGMPVSQDEWKEKMGTSEGLYEQPFIPSPLYVGEPMNETFAVKTVAEIIDLVKNAVPFRIKEYEDIEIIIEIMGKYLNEVSPYIAQNKELEIYIRSLNAAAQKMIQYKQLIDKFIESISPEKRDRSLAALLQYVN